ncbi:radical SAM/SPASM domain-containing protein [Anthocerotibacter panamensis]|uniref:radical SAM/SPASM domain-containing protein n=1 Tax=Anthocerotibacter panamensis TaxID=2857077 RepID=UPI001C40309E|nr:radical SAM/SPASM domain-containing protein [Anthocerotibacter panamensis]
MRVHIELTSQCNFNCAFCPEADLLRPKRAMDWDLLVKILHELAETGLADYITFHVLGEPMLYPRFFEAVALAVELGLPLHLTTNGSTFALRPQDRELLTRLPLTKVILSLQTPDAKTFDLRGAPPRLTAEDYFAGILAYVQEHLASPSPTRVHLKFMDTSPHPLLVPHRPLHILDSRQALISEMERWLEPLGLTADCSGLKAGRWNVLPVPTAGGPPRLFLESFPLDSWANSALEEVYPARWGYCNGAAGQVGILQDGRVVPCCKDYEGVITLGDLNHQTLQAVLADQPACHLREGFDRLQVRHSHCQQCMGADSQNKTLLRQGASALYFKIYKPLHALLGKPLEN